MELICYLTIMVIGVLFSLNRDLIKHKTIFFVFWLFIYFTLSLIVRADYDFDINVYAKSMSFSSFSLYYLKEPVVWLGQRYLFTLINSTFVVFVIFDMLVGILLFMSLRNLKVPQYAFFSIIIFFPFLLGMQNIYRQWVASVIFLYCFSFAWKEKDTVKTYIFFVISFLSHNVAAVFFPLLLVRKRRFFGKVAWFLSFIVCFFGIYFGSTSKSSRETGADLSIAYLILLFFFLCLILILDKGVFRKIHKVEYKILFTLFALSSFGAILLAGAGSERVSMFSILVAYPILVNFLEERFMQKQIIRISYTVMGFMPIFLFSVSQFIV